MKEGHFLDNLDLDLDRSTSNYSQLFNILPKNTSRVFSEIREGVNREQQKVGVI